MFDKEESKKFIKAKIVNINFKKVGSLLLTTAAITLFTPSTHATSFEDTTIWERKMHEYTEKMRNDKITYDKHITKIFHKGLLIYDNQKSEIQDLFLVYGYKDKKFKAYLINVKKGLVDLLVGDEIHFERLGAVRFRDTTSFIEILKNNEIVEIDGNNIIVMNNTKLQEILDNWDGYIHSEVKETNNAFNKLILDRKSNRNER